MSLNTEEFRRLLDRLRCGGEAPAQELIARYGKLLLRAVRRQMHRKLRTKFDSQDFVQDVWASFFAQFPAGRSFDGPQDLIAFLVAVARNKVAAAVRQRLVEGKYNVEREVSLNELALEVQETLAAPLPTPSTVAMSREEWERLLQGQPLVYRRILLLLREGLRPAEVAQTMSINERLVYRVAKRFIPGWLL
jgi:RNA polymerase sigma-70 factor (ECF subfamily)